MRQRQRLGQILIEIEPAGQAAGDLRHLDAVRQPRAEMLALMEDEDLRLAIFPKKADSSYGSCLFSFRHRTGYRHCSAHSHSGLREHPQHLW